jgi:hypothetical protein
MGCYIMLSKKYVVRWKEKTSCLLLSGIHFVSTQIIRKQKKKKWFNKKIGSSIIGSLVSM